MIDPIEPDEKKVYNTNLLDQLMKYILTHNNQGLY